MYTIQCDKSLIKPLTDFFNSLDINTKASDLYEISDICILRENTLNKISKSKYIILNSDNKQLIKSIKNSTANIISCGISSRSTVTLSSITDNSFMMCLQRGVTDLNGNKISPFEMPFEYSQEKFDEITTIMFIVSAIICGADILKIKKYI